MITFACAFLYITSAVVGATANEGLAYLESKGKEKGVVTLPSGLLYREIRPGNPDGKSPTLSSPCECHYAGTLIDGTEFDSSYRRGEPLTFAPDQVITGWTEAMQLMTEGAKWELFLPPELGYGHQGAGGSIPGGSVLIFTLELLKVNDVVKSHAEGLAFLAAKGKEDGVVTLPSGLLYKEIRAGKPDGNTPTLRSPCECHYTISTMDGNEFDSSYARGQPITLAPGEWIKGCKEAMQLMKEGAIWELTIPYELGYPALDDGGPISVGTVLTFTLELLKVKGGRHDEL